LPLCFGRQSLPRLKRLALLNYEPTYMSDSGCRHLFERALQGGYLDTAAEGLPAPGMREALHDYLGAKAAGTPGRRKHFGKEEEGRTLAAQLLATDPQNLAFAPTTSDALNLLAASLPVETGDEVVVTDLEFPSNVLPWLALGRKGVRPVVVRSKAGALELADLANSITARTRLVSISLVSYKTGAYFTEVKELAKCVHEVGGLLCVDATQALGRCPVLLDGVDYLMASSFKWLMGPHGLAIVYLSPEFRERFDPLAVGWYSVQDPFAPDRFERYHLKPGAACISAGMPNFESLYGLCEALRFLQTLDLSCEQKRVNRLCTDLRHALNARRLHLLTPAAPELISGIVSFEHPQAEAIGKALERENIIVWAGDGRVRASLHFYNDERDVSRYLGCLDQFLEQGSKG
jgi:cysteine desulfurase / selenocysteine lyase